MVCRSLSDWLSIHAHEKFWAVSEIILRNPFQQKQVIRCNATTDLLQSEKVPHIQIFLIPVLKDKVLHQILLHSSTWNCLSDNLWLTTLWNLRLPYLNQLWWIIYLWKKVVCFVLLCSYEIHRTWMLQIVFLVSLENSRWGRVPWHLDLRCKSSWILNDFFTEKLN
jgi:hypothetical protein